MPAREGKQSCKQGVLGPVSFLRQEEVGGRNQADTSLVGAGKRRIVKTTEIKGAMDNLHACQEEVSVSF